MFSKTKLAIVIASTLATGAVYASSLTTAKTPEEISRTEIGSEFAHILNADNGSVLEQNTIMSGDGKVLVLFAADFSGAQETASRIFFGDDFSKKHIISGDVDNGVPTLSYDGSIVVHYFNTYTVREGDKWIEHKVPETENYTLLGVTPSGLLYGIGNDNAIQLRTPIDHKVVKEKFIGKFAPIVGRNHDGSVLLTKFGNPTVYYGENYSKKKELIFFKDGVYADGISGLVSGELAKVSPDGNVIMNHDIVYSGPDYEKKTVVSKTLNGKTDPNSVVILQVANKDGSVLGGSIAGPQLEGGNDFRREYRPVIWFGKDWSETKDLGTLGQKDTDQGIVYAMSDDGEVMTGLSTNAEGKYAVTLWKLIKKEEPQIEPQVAPQVEPEQPKNDFDTVAIDAAKTRESVAKRAASTLNMFENQYYGLRSLLNGCDIENEQAGSYCVSARSNLAGRQNAREVKVGVSGAYNFTENWSAGFVLDHTVYAKWTDGYHRNKNNYGASVHAQWKNKYNDTTEFYIRPALSFSNYKMNVDRPMLAGTELGHGKTRFKGLMLSLTLGQNYQGKEFALGWNAGVRHSRLAQNAYNETDIAFPISYGKASYKDISVFAGLNVKKAVTEKLNWLAALEVETAFKQKHPEMKAYNQYLGEMTHSKTMPKTSISFATGVEYKLNQNFRLELMPKVTKVNHGPVRWDVSLNLTGQF
ncbi:autotransporter domain-containing protein [Pasteurellaceae bacterium 22721_9_1]